MISIECLDTLSQRTDLNKAIKENFRKSEKNLCGIFIENWYVNAENVWAG